jgi:hypothetical protein
MDRDKMNKPYRGPSIDASYQVSMCRNLVGNIYGKYSVAIAHFVPIRLQTWPSQAIIVSDWPILDRDKMNKPYRGPSIDASYQVSALMANRFQRRRFFLK